MTRWYTPKNGPLLNVKSETSINNIADHLYIGSLGSARVIKFKAFVKDYKVNLSSNIEQKKDPLIHSRVYVATTGDWSWNISFDLPALNIQESKRNLAKVMELQKMLTMNASGVDWKQISRTETSWVVHYKNLICDNNINRYNEVEPQHWTDLLKKGVHVWCDEVKYSPDLDMGFFIDDNGTYPKNITLNLTLNLRNSEKDLLRWTKDYGIVDKLYYINSFNIKGQYTNDASFLTPFGVSLIDRGSNAEIKTTKEINNNCEGEQNFFYIALPYSTAPNDLNDVEKMGSTNKNGPCAKILAFKGFLEKFETSQKVENKTATVHSHPDNPIKKYNETTKNDDYDYEVTIKVPSDSLEEARINLGKLQWLIRMYFTKNVQPSFLSTDDIPYSLNIQKVRVFLPGLIQKPGASLVNINYNHSFAPYFHSISAALEFTKLDITFDNEMGFFRSRDDEDASDEGPYKEQNSIYPKSFSISMSFSFSNEFVHNYELTPENKFSIIKPPTPGEGEKEKWGIFNGTEKHNFPIGSIFNQPEELPPPPPRTPGEFSDFFPRSPVGPDAVAIDGSGFEFRADQTVRGGGVISVTTKTSPEMAAMIEAGVPTTEEAARKLLNPNDE